MYTNDAKAAISLISYIYSSGKYITSAYQKRLDSKWKKTLSGHLVLKVYKNIKISPRGIAQLVPIEKPTTGLHIQKICC